MAVFVGLMRRATIIMALFGALSGLAGGSAQARVFVGVGVPFFGPGYYPPPAYYPPPVYYPPPPVYYAPPPVLYAPPPQTYSPAPPPGARQACFAGPYSCPMDHPVTIGANCYCLGNGGERVWGRAN